ncbi:MAG: glycerate kinase, partial [Nitrospirae bacterium]
VTVRGRGRGGRNQELALAAALKLEGGPPRVLLAAGTDGIDGLTDAAGAVVDAGTAGRIRAAGIDPAAALRDNDSGTALAACGDALVTGPTGTNVCDVTLLLA